MPVLVKVLLRVEGFLSRNHLLTFDILRFLRQWHRHTTDGIIDAYSCLPEESDGSVPALCLHVLRPVLRLSTLIALNKIKKFPC